MSGDQRELGLCVALSVGELPEQDYQELFDAGASLCSMTRFHRSCMICVCECVCRGTCAQ